MSHEGDPLRPEPAAAARADARWDTAVGPQRTAMGDAMAALHRRWVVILIAVVLGALAGALLRATSTPSYAATAKVLLDQQHPVDALLGVAQPPPDPTRELSTSVRLIALEPVAEQARRRLRLTGSTSDLLSRVTVKLDGNTNIVDITARDRDARQAARIADEFALGYQRLRAQSAGASLAQAAQAGRERLLRLGPGAAATPVGRELAGEIRRLEVLGALQTGGVQIVRRATVPAARAGIGTAGAAIAGGLLAGLLAVGLVVLLSRNDPRLYDEDDAERALGLPVLAAVPRRRSGRGGRRTGLEGRDPPVEAYATLARLGFAQADKQSSVLLVASPTDGEGTPEVVLDLVCAMSALGRSVLAIDADLRAPRLAQMAGVQSGGGLAALLAGDARPEQLEDQLVELELMGPYRPSWEGDAWLLPAGPAGSLSQALLGAPAMAAILDGARRRVDGVVIAGGALAEPGPTLSLAPAVDAAVLVVRRGQHTEAARRAVRSLQALDVRVVGVVLTAGPGRRRDRGLRARGGGPDGAAAGAAERGAAAGDGVAPDAVRR
jgi:Mrp family chromosome partitioning ATPase